MNERKFLEMNRYNKSNIIISNTKKNSEMQRSRFLEFQ